MMKSKYYKFQLIFGLILFAIGILLFLSFNSYWEHGVFDQSEIIQDTISSKKINNNIGWKGAQMSEFLIRIFGISAYLLTSLTLFISIKIMFNIKRINIVKNLSQHVFLLMWIPMIFATGKNYQLSGILGKNMSDKIYLLIGQTGLIILLIITMIIFIIVVLDLRKEQVLKIQKKTKSIIKLSFIKTITNVFKSDKTLEKEINNIEESTQNHHINENKEEKGIQPKKNKIIVEIGKEEKTFDKNEPNHEKKDNTIRYQFPDLNLLKEYSENKISIDNTEVEANKKLIEDTLKDFKIEVSVKRATVGPTITLYEIVPDEGVRIAKIKNLENDIALRIKAVGVRIIAPLPGKGTVGIEVPNQKPTIVSMKNVIESEKFQKANLELPIALGKTISNETFVMDLTQMPHLLIAGATGQGKSVGLNTILCSILYKKHPDEVKFILVDPKKVELTLYNKILNQFLAKLPNDDDAIITDTKMVVQTLTSLCIEMDRRYELLKKAEVRNIQEYNTKYKDNKLNDNTAHKFLPYLVLVIDEFADLIMTAGKEIEIPIARLAQLSRAIGIHLIIATQRPTTNIITGTIKANFPTRIAFRVIQGIDSKTILDTVGANQLIGRGDMLISTGSNLERIQCAFIDTDEVETLTNFIGSQLIESKAFELPLIETEKNEIKENTNKERDPLFREAALLIVMNQQGSTSMIQRKLKLGYNRAGRIIDQLEDAGVIGPLRGSKGREVLIQTEDELNQII